VCRQLVHVAISCGTRAGSRWAVGPTHPWAPAAGPNRKSSPCSRPAVSAHGGCWVSACPCTMLGCSAPHQHLQLTLPPYPPTHAACYGTMGVRAAASAAAGGALATPSATLCSSNNAPNVVPAPAPPAPCPAIAHHHIRGPPHTPPPPSQAHMVEEWSLDEVADGDAVFRRIAEAQLGPLLAVRGTGLGRQQGGRRGRGSRGSSTTTTTPSSSSSTAGNGAQRHRHSCWWCCLGARRCLSGIGVAAQPPVSAQGHRRDVTGGIVLNHSNLPSMACPCTRDP
jgi:hypothetical protein